MKGPPVDKLVHEYMFPKLRASDPSSFQAFLTRHLIGEVRSETQAYYGHLDTQEAKYPGLDYNDRIHRIRLSRYPWHRRLFRAFDGLGLTPSEISGLTRWEGTRWAKEKYELEHGVQIRDTAGDGIPYWDDDLGYAVSLDDPDAPEDDAVTASNPDGRQAEGQGVAQRGDDEDEDEDDEGDRNDDEEDGASEPDIQSVGIELNARLRAGAARREAGDTNAVLDEEWEQWLKHVVDSGLLHDNMTEQSFRQFFETTVIPAGLVPVDIMTAARAGNWSRVPDFLHTLLRRTLESDHPWAASPSSTTATATTTPAARTARSSLRLSRTRQPSIAQIAADAPGA